MKVEIDASELADASLSMFRARAKIDDLERELERVKVALANALSERDRLRAEAANG